MAVISRRISRRTRRAVEGSARLWAASPLTYAVLIFGIVLSAFPLYWMFVVATRTNDVVGAVQPLFHILGQEIAMHLALLRGATVVIMPQFEPAAFLHAVQDYRVTRAAVVPPILLALAKSPLADDYDVSSLRMLTSAAAPLGADLAHAAARRLGCRVRQGYGLTELAGGTHAAPEVGPDRPLCLIHAADETSWNRAAAALRAAVKVGDGAPAGHSPILDRIALD